ncbi:MAG: LTA synthase family protein, partial [Phycisphaerae bacterium]|nr:LTA synthase family protein [Phycisphaerae bacterium]
WRSRFRSLFLYAAVFFAASFGLRVALLAKSWPSADTRPTALAWAFLVGVFFDMLGCAIAALPLALLLGLSTQRFLAGRLGRTLTIGMYAMGVFMVFYDVAVEWYFWGEFTSRFNLIAVDYLKDFGVVVRFIRDQYPVLPVTGAIAAITALIVVPTVKGVSRSCGAPLGAAARSRFLGAQAGLAVVTALFVFHQSWALGGDNWTNRNLARNGLVALATTFANANVTYDEGEYLTRHPRNVMVRLRQLLKADNSEYLQPEPTDIARRINNGPAATPHNVLIIVVESLSADFVGALGGKDGLTPNLDKLAEESLFFTRLYACGNRTIRGLEAINLSLPPTPGRALAKRPASHELFSAEHLMRGTLGYKTLFFYGGRGNFDNMDEFLCNGGFTLVDERDFQPDEIHFRTAWGICDGDVFHRSIREFDEVHDAGGMFYAMIMTVSNHIPFKYPKSIDIPSGMLGAVKYTDYAIGQFLKEAAARPWFKDTIFVITADHCQRHLAREPEAPAVKFHIPAIIYAPGLVKPQRYDGVCSQIDLVPTVLGLMHTSYESRFFGQDVLHAPPDRAFLGMPTDLALLIGDRKTVLSPGRQARCFHVEPNEYEKRINVNPDDLEKAITYYQGAGILLKDRPNDAR